MTTVFGTGIVSAGVASYDILGKMVLLAPGLHDPIEVLRCRLCKVLVLSGDEWEHSNEAHPLLAPAVSVYETKPVEPSERWVLSFIVAGWTLQVCNDCGALVRSTEVWRHDEYHDEELYA